MFNFFKNKSKETINNTYTQLELRYAFLELMTLENKTYRIENCTPEFISFVKKSGFNCKSYGSNLDVLEGNSNEYTVILKCSLESFQKRINYAKSTISDYIQFLLEEVKFS